MDTRRGRAPRGAGELRWYRGRVSRPLAAHGASEVFLYPFSRKWHKKHRPPSLLFHFYVLHFKGINSPVGQKGVISGERGKTGAEPGPV